MSIVINIYYKGTNGNAKKFAKEMVDSGLVEKIRNEKGNIRYDYFFKLDDEETLLLVDEWENQDAIDRHHETYMMQTIATLREKYDLHMKVDRFVRQNNDSDDNDKKYIRE